MEPLDWKSVRPRLETLRRRDIGKVVFGAASHGHELRAPLTEAELTAAEDQWAVWSCPGLVDTQRGLR
jgi:hypothetical protein